MIVESARDPEYKEDGNIKLFVKFKEMDEYVPFLAAPGNTYHNMDIYEEALAGSYGEIKEYTPDLDFKKSQKKYQIKTQYVLACMESVKMDKGEFNGGLSSSIAIFNAATLAEYLGEEGVAITDINNQEISCSIDEARLIASTVGVAYRNLFYKKQNLMVAIDAASSVSELETIVWDN